MGTLNLAMKDISRQKQRSLLFISVQSSITASGMIFYGLSKSLIAQLGRTEAFFNSILLQVFNGQLSFLFFFSIAAGICVASILSSLLTIARMNDLAVIQSLGGTFKRTQRLILSQIFLLTFFSGIIGWVLGIIGLSGFNLLFGFHQDPFESLNFVFGFLYITGLIIGTYFIAGFIVNILIRKKSQEIVNGQFDLTPINTNKLWGFFQLKQRASLRLANLFVKRSRVLSWVVTFGMFMLIFLTSFGILGGNIIMITANSYVDRGYGDNIFVITSPELSIMLQDLYNPSKEIIFDDTYLAEEYSLDSSFLSQLSAFSTAYEARLLLLGDVKLIPGIDLDPSLINRSTGWVTKQAYYWGIDTSSLFDYYTIGNFSIPNEDSVYIGDGIPQYALTGQKAHAIIPFYDETDEVQKLEIKGVVLDPFALGNCIFVNLAKMSTMLELQNPTMKNVLFISNPSEEVFNLIEEFSLESFSLNENKAQYNSLSRSFWITSTIAFIPVILSAVLSLVAYSGLIARVVLIKDLRTLRALGSNQKFLRQIIIRVNLLIIIFAAPLGIFLGFSISYSSLIEDALLPTIEAWGILIIEFGTMALLLYGYLYLLFKEFYQNV